MNILQRALTPETYTNALEDPGSAIKNVVSDPAFGLVAGLALGPAGYGLTSLQAAMAAGGISALATGSLQKGLMSGLSAYGGAGLSGSLMNAGASDIAANAVHEGAIGGQTAGFGNQALQYPSVANASALDKISAGFGAATSSSDAALQFAKDNYGKALMAAGPILADQMVATKTPLPSAGSLTGPSYIRPYSMTRKVRQPEKDIGSREQDWFETTWERGTPYKAANGGIVALAGGGTTSQDAYDFLMGKKSDTGSMVNTVTKAPTYEGRYEYDPITGTSRFVPARMDMTTALKPVTLPTTPITPTTDAAGITTLVPGFGNPNAAAITAASFDAMTPAQKADHQAVMANLSEALTPVAVKVLQAIKNKILFKNPNEAPAEVVNMDTLSPAAVAEGSAATSSGGVSSTSGSPMGGIASTGTVGQANAAVGAANAATAAAVGAGTTGGTTSGMGGMGTGAAGAATSAGVSGVGVGVGGGGGGGVGGVGGGNGSGGSSAGGSSAGSAYSDVRMKDNIKPIGNALSKVKKLDGITYDMAGKRGAGLAAQQVEKVLPEVVHKDAKGMRKLDYGNTVGLLVEAVKELDAKKKAGGGMLQGYATGGLSDLGSYSDGGRLLRGPGDGVSDSIPAMIGKNQPARLADGEFVVPARIVSEIGNGSTEAGARKLYAMMDRIQAARRKTVGKGKVATNTKADKYLPA
jgi:hypothetical protein